MKEFFRVMRQFVTPYKGYLIGSLVFNLLSAILNVFSFISIIPMLQMLFGIDKHKYDFIPWDTVGMTIKDNAVAAPKRSISWVVYQYMLFTAMSLMACS